MLAPWTEDELVCQLVAGDVSATELLWQMTRSFVAERCPYLEAGEAVAYVAITELKRDHYKKLRTRREHALEQVLGGCVRKALTEKLTEIKMIMRDALGASFIEFFGNTARGARDNHQVFAGFFEANFRATPPEAVTLAAYYWPEPNYTGKAGNDLHQLALASADHHCDPQCVKRYCGQAADYRKRGNRKILDALRSMNLDAAAHQEVAFMIEFCEASTEVVARKFGYRRGIGHG